MPLQRPEMVGLSKVVLPQTDRWLAGISFQSQPERQRALGIDYPTCIEWRAWRAGRTSTKALVLRNISNRTVLLRYRQLATPHFVMDCPNPLKLSPGMAVAGAVTFCAPSREHYDKGVLHYADVVHFSAMGKKGGSRGAGQDESFSVNLRAVMASVRLIMPTRVDFGYACVGEWTERKVQIQNVGEFGVRYEWKVDNPFDIDPDEGAINAGEGTIVTLRYRPEAASFQTGMAFCFTQGGLGNKLKLTGVGKYPALVLSQTSLDFGKVISGCSLEREIILRNSSAVSATFLIKRVSDLATDQDHTVSVSPLQGLVQPGSHILLKISFAPVATGTHSVEYFNILSNLLTGPPLTVCGMAVGPSISLSPPSLHFGTVTIGSSKARSMLLENHSEVLVHYQVMVEDAGVFQFDQMNGVIQPCSCVAVTVHFRPMGPMHYYKHAICVAKHAQTPLVCELIGMGFLKRLLHPGQLFGQHSDKYRDGPGLGSFETQLVDNPYVKTVTSLPKKAGFPHSLQSRQVNNDYKLDHSDIIMPVVEQQNQLLSDHDAAWTTASKVKQLLQMSAGKERVSQAPMDVLDATDFAMDLAHEDQAKQTHVPEEMSFSSAWEVLFRNGCAWPCCWATGIQQSELISLQPSKIDFGSCSPLHASKYQRVNVTNNDTQPIICVWIIPNCEDSVHSPGGGKRDHNLGHEQEMSGARAGLTPIVLGPIFQAFPKQAEIRPGGTFTFRLIFQPRKSNCYYSKMLECIAYRNHTPIFRKAHSDELVHPYSICINVTGHTFQKDTQEFIPRGSFAPSTIRFPPVHSGYPSYQTAILRNNGHTPLRFMFVEDNLHPAFQLRPMEGVVAGNDFQIVAFRYKSWSPKSQKCQVLCVLNHSIRHALTLNLHGYSCAAKLQLGTGAKLVFKSTCVGTMSRRYLRLHNTSPIPVWFRWIIPSKSCHIFHVSPDTGFLRGNEVIFATWLFAPLTRAKYNLKVICEAYATGPPPRSVPAIPTRARGVDDPITEPLPMHTAVTAPLDFRAVYTMARSRRESNGHRDDSQESQQLPPGQVLPAWDVAHPPDYKAILALEADGTCGLVTIEPTLLDFGAVIAGSRSSMDFIMYNHSDCDLFYDLAYREEDKHLRDVVGVTSKKRNRDTTLEVPDEHHGLPGVTLVNDVRLQLSESRGVLPSRSHKRIEVSFKPMRRALYSYQIVCWVVAFNHLVIPAGRSRERASQLQIDSTDLTSTLGSNKEKRHDEGETTASKSKFDIRGSNMAPGCRVETPEMLEAARRARRSIEFEGQLAIETGDPRSSGTAAEVRMSAHATFPALSIIETRCFGLSKTQAWNQLNVDAINHELSLPLSKSEILLNSTGRYETFAATLNRLQPMPFDFGAKSWRSEATTIHVLFKNVEALRATWRLRIWGQGDLNMEGWVDGGEPLSAEERSRAAVVENELFSVYPTAGELGLGETVHIVFCYYHDVVGKHELPAVLEVAQGKWIHLNLIGTTYESAELVSFSGQELRFRPFPIGEKSPLIQTYEIRNGGPSALPYSVSMAPLRRLRQENFDFQVVSCTNAQGLLPVANSVQLKWTFMPLEEKEYSVETTLQVGSEERICLRVVGHGFQPCARRRWATLSSTEHQDIVDGMPLAAMVEPASGPSNSLCGIPSKKNPLPQDPRFSNISWPREAVGRPSKMYYGLKSRNGPSDYHYSISKGQALRTRHRQILILPYQLGMLSTEIVLFGKVPQHSINRQIVILQNRVFTTKVKFAWRLGHEGQKSALGHLAVIPAEGVLDRARKCVCKIVFAASSHSQFFETVLRCDLEPLPNIGNDAFTKSTIPQFSEESSKMTRNSKDGRQPATQFHNAQMNIGLRSSLYQLDHLAITDPGLLDSDHRTATESVIANGRRGRRSSDCRQWSATSQMMVEKQMENENGTNVIADETKDVTLTQRSQDIIREDLDKVAAFHTRKNSKTFQSALRATTENVCRRLPRLAENLVFANTLEEVENRRGHPNLDRPQNKTVLCLTVSAYVQAIDEIKLYPTSDINMFFIPPLKRPDGSSSDTDRRAALGKGNLPSGQIAGRPGEEESKHEEEVVSVASTQVGQRVKTIQDILRLLLQLSLAGVVSTGVLCVPNREAPSFFTQWQLNTSPPLSRDSTTDDTSFTTSDSLTDHGVGSDLAIVERGEHGRLSASQPARTHDDNDNFATSTTMSPLDSLGSSHTNNVILADKEGTEHLNGSGNTIVATTVSLSEPGSKGLSEPRTQDVLHLHQAALLPLTDGLSPPQALREQIADDLTAASELQNVLSETATHTEVSAEIPETTRSIAGTTGGHNKGSGNLGLSEPFNRIKASHQRDVPRTVQAQGFFEIAEFVLEETLFCIIREKLSGHVGAI
ncbi:hypothetical protein CBR_g40394 [Chara braunii]|uniref:Abnormal spindle-like microcephaly-associated protein ASH domain-containing protein n=1 Tax=Chara braunii TaxID=69332 RepID=A0A388LTX7_CHABU|nr:hypothetical protein CBR_g40394 [Chara braunii]|eukprot:GBG85662.1 hypothetical protein CBR_g40394 [Chara braunii]